MINKETFLADSEWREILTKALSKTAWACLPLETAVVKVFAASKGKKDGPAWLAVIQATDGTKPVLAIKYRDGEIPAEERATVPGNNLEFVVAIGYGHGLPDGVYEADFGWLCYGDELKRLGLPWRGRWRRLMRKVCNRRGLKCRKPAVLVIGDGFWFCEKHAPTAWADQRAGVLKKIEAEAAAHEELAEELASKEGEDWAVEIQTLLHMAEALRKRHRVLSKRKCWTLLSPPEEVAHVGG